MSTLLSIISSGVILFCIIKFNIISLAKLYKYEAVNKKLQPLYELYDQKYQEHINRNLDKITIKKLAGEKYYFSFRIRNKYLPKFCSPAISHDIFLHMYSYIQQQGHIVYDWDVCGFYNQKPKNKNATIIKIIIEI